MAQQWWLVGEVARSMGLSVRTLHYYDEIGLLTPTQRDVNGYRLYSTADLLRLQRIILLRKLGLALDDLKRLINAPTLSSLDVMQLHLQRLGEQIALQQQLYVQLEAVILHLQTLDNPSFETLFTLLEVFQTMDTYLTPHQIETLKQQVALLPEAQQQAIQQEWPDLINRVRTAMQQGLAADAPEVQALAQRWQTLVSMSTGGDVTLDESVRTLYEQEPEFAAQHAPGLDAEVFAFIGQALAHTS